MDPLILASASPQRAALLSGLGVEFVIVPSLVNEEACTERDPVKRAQVLSREKAQEVAERHRGRWIIGCDTLVMAHDGTLLEKPTDAADARRMLELQSGHESTVHSGLTIITPANVCVSGISSSTVRFRTLSDKDKNWWIASGHWKDRSGGFQIDGPGQLMIERINGDWTSIVGLPVYLLGELARQTGLKL